MISSSARPAGRVHGIRGLFTFALVTVLVSPVAVVARQDVGAGLGSPINEIPFDVALPSLDVATPPAAAAPPQSPAVPSLPVATTQPLIPDSEITRPLVPLAAFDATPPAITAAEAAAEPTLRIRYTTEIRGLNGVRTNAPEGDLGSQFRALSALIKDGKTAANAAQVHARADEDVQLAERIMRAAGYYDGIATATVDLVPDRPKEVRVTLVATPGSRYDLGHIAIARAPPEPARIAYDALGLKIGQPIDAALIEGAEANVALRLPELGYPFAQVGQRDIALDDAAHSGDYTLDIHAGPKSRFGAIRTSGDNVFDMRHLAIFPRYKKGQVYDSRRVEDLRQALVATGLFSTVSVEPVSADAPGAEKINADGTENVDLAVRQTKGPWHSLSGLAGYATGQGATLTGSYTWRNLFPPEGALILTAVAGTQEQGGSATFRRSNAGQRDRTFQAILAVNRTRYSAYQANTADLAVSLSRQSTPIWQKRWTWSLGGEIVGTNEEGAALALDGPRPRRNYLIGAIPLQLGYDRSNDLLNPGKGFRITGKLSPETSLQGGRVKPYARTLIQVSVYYPVRHSLVLAARAQAGAILGTALADLAPSRRLYSGGGGSVRGYGYQQLGPKDANHNPIGGRNQVEFAIEARYRFGNFGIVPFFDAGRVSESSTPGFSGMRYGAGIGGRYYTNFGPVRIDLATPIARRLGEAKVALYIGIGQAF